MKNTFLLFTLALILSNLGFGQNVLFLKNGDKMNGKLEGFKNDTIIFKLQENKLKFKTSDIASIYFDEKLALNDLKKEIRPSQDSRIFGVVTFYFNANYGYKPDVGAEVYIVDSVKSPNFNVETIDSLCIGSGYRDLYLYYSKKGTPVPNDILITVKKYNVENESSFNSLDKRAFTILYKTMFNDENTIKNIVDGNGNYSIKVKPGTYYICIKSSNRKGLNLTEGTGRVICKKIVVKDGNEINVSKQFSSR